MNTPQKPLTLPPSDLFGILLEHREQMQQEGQESLVDAIDHALKDWERMDKLDALKRSRSIFDAPRDTNFTDVLDPYIGGTARTATDVMPNAGEQTTPVTI